LWAIANGCISTITPTSGKAKLVVFMLMAGSGGGQVGVSFATFLVYF
jgi:hypothetical protein